ncbi:helix-turn-helix domain-containing protein [Chryseobacterium indologenes]|uniref:helix-turn-helix domain-containing protein n=1 Tax=Chryseobacterium indologenes TaxID=253 RepID=UPI001107D6D2|nr:helix-turn-helix domain-containing protein [Chryseobacterium indologenes]TLX23346.1 helix-turn-helix domain-containing protein [Chryseobacterium indologenes]
MSNSNTLLVQMTKDELMQDFEQIVRKVVNQMQVQQISKDEKETYTRDEAAEYLNVSHSTLHNWKKKGILMPFKMGAKVYYSKDEVKARLKIN